MISEYLIKQAINGKHSQQQMSKSGAFTLLGTPIGAALGTMTNNAPGRKAQGFNHGASVGLLGGIGADVLAALGTYLGAKADAPGTGAALGAILGAGVSYPLAHKFLKAQEQEAEQRENQNKINLIQQLQAQGVNPTAAIGL